MIIYACPDLMFASRISATARAHNCIARPARDLEMLQKRLDREDDGKPNEPVRVLIVDLGLEDTALEMIRQAKAHDSNITLIAYGSHVLTDLLQSAQQAGADRVMTNGSFASNLESIFASLAK